MTLYDDLLAGTEHTFTETTSTNNNFGDIGFSKMATSWKCACFPKLNIRAQCDDPKDNEVHDGEYVAYLGFGNKVMYERTTRTANGKWVYLRYATTGSKWERASKSQRLQSGEKIWSKTLTDLNSNLKGKLHKCCLILISEFFRLYSPIINSPK